MEKIYGMHKLVGLQLFWSGTPTFCQMGVLNSCFQNPSESSVIASFMNNIPISYVYQSTESTGGDGCIEAFK